MTIENNEFIDFLLANGFHYHILKIGRKYYFQEETGPYCPRRSLRTYNDGKFQLCFDGSFCTIKYKWRPMYQFMFAKEPQFMKFEYLEIPQHVLDFVQTKKITYDVVKFHRPYFYKLMRKLLPPRLKIRYISKQVRLEVFVKCDSKCSFCGATEKLEVDHIHPFSKGGTHHISNLQLLCKTCNLKKFDSILTAII